MNQEKIGKFIADERKKKKLTQTELAKRIGVSNKTVSKWECGNAIPDYGVFDNLCKEFNISVNELLNGEKDMKDDKVIGEYMKMKNKQNRNKIIIVIIISFLVLLSSVLGIYFVNSYDKTNMYQLSGSTDNFKFSGGLLVTSNIKNIFQRGELKINVKDIREDDIAESYYAFEVDGKYYKLLDYNGTNLEIEKYGEDLIVPTKMKDYIPKNLHLIVIYYKDENVYTETIKIKAKKIFSNNKFINVKSDPSDSAKLELVDLDKVFNPFKYKEQLLKEGFTEPTKEDTKNFYGFYEVGLIKKNGEETIFIDYMNYSLMYSVDNKNYGIVTVARNKNYSNHCTADTIGFNDLYVLGSMDGQYFYTRAYEGCHGTYIKGDLTIDISKDIERFKELNKLYAYKDE